MNWKKQLEKKVKEINPKLLEGGETKDESVSVRSSGRGNINDSRNTRDKVFKGKWKNINPIKGGELMITRDGALSDLDKLEKIAGDNVLGKVVIGSVKVLVKFLSTMRSNQLLTDDDKRAIAKKKAERKPREEKKAE